MLRRRKRRKRRMPARRRTEKLVIWAAHRDPVGHKFYGKAKKKDGEWKHFEFSVITESVPKKAMYLAVKKTMKMLKYGKKLPVKHYYHTYDGFHTLFLYTEWIEVEEVIPDYKHTAT